ncbi:sensor histidine kinase, partial [Candidatus Chrysopegis kryptomonas]
IRHLQRVESIGTFTMGMAHDFNNILQIIVASAQMIDLKFQRGELKKEDLKKYIDNIISISNRGAELIKRLKIFTRKEIPNAEILDFEQVVLNTVDLLRSLFPKFIDIEVRSNCAGVKVYGSRIEIQQAFLNIAINAKDAIVEKKEKGMLNENGKILIETCVKDITLEDADIFKVNPGKYVCVSVSDNGIGMDEKTKSRIFEPFFTTKRPEIGTGLGMATVFGIVTSHGGFITVDSKLGEGTKVAFYLPVVSIDEIPKVGQKVKEVEKGTGATVMIICENQNLKSKLKSFFESKGVEILFADDKVIAVKVLNENSEKIGTILIDSKTPRLKLKDTIAELKILKPSVKIILLYSTQETSEIEGVEVIENPESEMEKLIELARL